MYAGHAAIATFVKGKRPELPLMLLVPAAFGPDWIDTLSHIAHHPNPEISHSLISVGICSGVLALATLSRFGGRDAIAVGATYASHWVVDCITGLKPTWPNGPQIGLQLYKHPGVDFVLESLVVGACWMVYRTSLAPEKRASFLAAAMPLGLIAMQAVFAMLRAPALS